MISTVNLIFVIVGIVMLIGECIVLLRRRAFRKRAILTQGTVVDSSGGAYQHPTIEFSTPDGQKHQVTLNISTKPKWWKKGDPINLYYDPNDPQNISPVIGCIGFGVVGLITLMAVGFIFLGLITL